MTKQEHMEYLQVACDAENAVFACEKAIEALEEKINTIYPPEYPPQPKPVKYKDLPTTVDLSNFEAEQGKAGQYIGYHHEYSTYALILSIVVGIAAFALLVLFNPPISHIVDFLKWMLIPLAIFGITFFVSRSIAKRAIDRDHNQRVYKLYHNKRQAAQDKYNQEDQRFRKQLKVYDQGCQLTRDAKGKLEQELERLRAQVRTLDVQRQQVYALGVLHERFHNSLAVHQLYEYFEMGVCDTLEGPGGAIAQYLMDLRTNKICGSIDELRSAVEAGMQAIIANQGHILREVQDTNTRITSMGQALSSQLNFMQSNILSAQYAAQEKMQSYMETATKHLDTISATLKDAAHNEYITMKAAKVAGYLDLHRA